MGLLLLAGASREKDARERWQYALFGLAHLLVAAGLVALVFTL